MNGHCCYLKVKSSNNTSMNMWEVIWNLRLRRGGKVKDALQKERLGYKTSCEKYHFWYNRKPFIYFCNHKSRWKNECVKVLATPLFSPSLGHVTCQLPILSAHYYIEWIGESSFISITFHFVLLFAITY
jgi:hypothetical protein